MHFKSSDENKQGISKIPCLQQCLQPTSTFFLLFYLLEFLCELAEQVSVHRKIQRFQRTKIRKQRMKIRENDQEMIFKRRQKKKHEEEKQQ